ncbi:RNA recognition motif domain-containing protein [Salinisphaera aquimarina]|uniref:RNA recognition motif domain-containing protein n=1 Tax=Salinisphaera aquimarina TaxID=2094031 RepID=A0ABV7EMU1_9GAMM
MNIYVGNLSWNTGDDELLSAFEGFGEVSSAKVIMDRETGRSRGFGFVEMPDDSAAKAAIDGMNNKDLDGRTLRVNEARPRDDKPRGPRRF